MTNHFARCFVGVVFATTLAATFAEEPTTAGHWPQWRGPNRDNVCTETGLLGDWPEGAPPRHALLATHRSSGIRGARNGIPVSSTDKVARDWAGPLRDRFDDTTWQDSEKLVAVFTDFGRQHRCALA